MENYGETETKPGGDGEFDWFDKLSEDREIEFLACKLHIQKSALFSLLLTW